MVGLLILNNKRWYWFTRSRESQLETDRRLIRVRITQLKDKLEKVHQTRMQGRAARQKLRSQLFH